jgi:chorismate dehydratase
LGKIGFLNVLPIYYPLESGIVSHSFSIVSSTPAYLNRLMAQGKLEISAVSSIEYARHPERYFLLPNLSISCCGPVGSVLLLSQVPMEKLEKQTILVTTQSETSAALLKILFSRFWNLEVTYKEGDLREVLARDQKPEVFLAIGNEALCLRSHPGYAYRWDLGEAWYRWTGLPFVFGVWTVQRSAVERWNGHLDDATQRLMAAKEWGRTHPEHICQVAARQEILDQRQLEDYYQGLSFDLGVEEQKGLELFFRYLYQAEEIDTIPPLNIYSPLASVA